MLTSKTVYEHIYPKKYFKEHVLQGIRPDGRKLLGYRPIALNVNIVNRADGSATLKIGNAVFICGINAELVVSDFATSRIVVSMSSPTSQIADSDSGGLNDKLVLCSELLTKLLKDSRIVDYSSMEIEQENLKWVLYCDILCMNYDGALFDGGLLVLLSALQTLKLPHVKYNVKTDSVEVDKNIKKCLKLKGFPVATSYGIFDDSIVLVDPTHKEEQLCGFSVLTIIVLDDDVCLMHKHGSSKIPSNIISPCILQAQKRIPLVSSLVKKVFDSKGINISC